MSQIQATLLKDLSIEEFKSLMIGIVKEAVQEEMEDIAALASPLYQQSIQQARDDYKNGKVKSFSDIFPNV
jgi:hypothetical protein